MIDNTKNEKQIDDFYEIRCPACRRKLMSIRAKSENEPKVMLLVPENHLQYDIEIRCPYCKVYVGIII